VNESWLNEHAMPFALISLKPIILLAFGKREEMGRRGSEKGLLNRKRLIALTDILANNNLPKALVILLVRLLVK
jgi:hypothetical protein